jgi:hypothetical protein
MSEPPIPERFQVREEIQRTATDLRLRARDTLLEREVVLELAGPALQKYLTGARDRTRALREARMLARVNHPSVCRLLEVLETPSGPLLVLEPVAGESVSAVLERQGRLTVDEVRRLGQAISAAAQAVHAVGVVHRGIDEQNILIGADGTPVLTGFAYAKPTGGLARSSIDYRNQGQTTIGDLPAPATPTHPAPEQIAGQAADARADVFGLGCVLYRCLAGRPAFPAGGTWEEPEALAKIVPDAPRNLAAAIHRCLARSPMARFQTMQDVHDALAADAAVARSGASRRAWLAAAATVCAIGIGAWSLAGGDREAERGRPLGGGGGATPRGGGTGEYAARYDTSRALLIGIDYSGGSGDFGTLANAENDVRAIGEALLALGWQAEHIATLVGPWATKANIERELALLRRQAGKDDQVFVYYAGHGEQSATDLGYAIPFDGRRNGVDLPVLTWVSFDSFDQVFRDCQAKHILVALDCCHSGASFRGAARSVDAPRGYEDYLVEKARVLMASSRSGEAANDGASDHSPFAAGFLEELEKARSGPIVTTSIHERVQRQLVRFPKQRPMRKLHESADEGADFLFFNRR